MTIDTKELRFAFGNFATGITIVTSLDADGEPLGITANSFSSVSLDPPLVLFSVDRGAYSLEAFQISRRFAINILSTDQEDMSNLCWFWSND